MNWLVSVFAVLLGLFIGSQSNAQDFSALARLDGVASSIRDTRGGVSVSLRLSQVVPYRVFTLDEPRRVIIDFKEVDFGSVRPTDVLRGSKIARLRMGSFRPGWSRIVADLTEPIVLETAEMSLASDGRYAELGIFFRDASPDEFASFAGAPPETYEWTEESVISAQPQVTGTENIVIAIDPGHGGVDPGAVRDGVVEAKIMLELAREVVDAVNRSGAGLQAVLTRTADQFVSLDERMTLARAAGARALVSLHADALEGGGASGASVYTLTEEAEDRAAERMAERHGRGDLLSGLDLSGQDDQVATALMDLARLETGPASDRLAESLITTFADVGVRLNNRPRREAGLAVLRSPDFASVLLEVGFLSNEEDREMLASEDSRIPLVAALVVALRRWAEAEAALAPLHRK